MTRLSLLLAASLAAAPASAATYYVSTSGSDAAAGSSAAPFKTIVKAVAVARAGDTIIVRSGTYGGGALPGTSGTSSAPITIRSEVSGGAVIDCATTCSSAFKFQNGASWWVIEGFEIRSTRNFGIELYAGGSNTIVRKNHIHHIGNVTDTTANGIAGVFVGEGITGVVIDGNVINDVGRNSVRDGAHDHGIYSYGSSNRITNNVFYNTRNGWHVQTAHGFSGTIANNTFVGPNTYSGKAGQIVIWDAAVSLVLRNNVFYGPNYAAVANVSVSYSGSCTIDHNVVYKPGGTVSLVDSFPSSCVQSANKLNVDPMLVNPAIPGDYHLKAGSPAIDAGAAVSGVTADFEGGLRPRGSAFDAGAYESGATSTSGGTTGGTTTPPAPGCTSSAATWQNTAITAQKDGFTLQFDSVPGGAAVDGVIGLSNGAASSYAGLAAAVRFNSAGRIDARNGGAYAAATSIPYTAGTTYHFRLVVDVLKHTYSAYVKAGTGAEQTIGTNYAFRTEQAGVTALSNLGSFAAAGTQSLCNPVVAAATTPTPTPAPSCTATQAAWKSLTLAPQTGLFTAEFDATASVTTSDGVLGLASTAATAYTGLAAAVRFNNAGRIDARNGAAYAAAASIPYEANTPYHFRLVVDLAKHVYSAYVRQGAGTEQAIGTNLAFRTEQAAVKTLSALSFSASAGTLTVCGAAVK